ncbi:MAG: glycosyltransferase, partial [Acidobacteriota bacterium]|nr:glycosyltransferase [Acidobacteriota bacterium]
MPVSVRLRAPDATAYSAECGSIVVGVTHPQTCLTLTGRLRALREAGFRVTLVASPGELLDNTAAREGVEAVAIPMERRITPLADLVSLARLWLLLRRLRPDLIEFSTPKAGLLGTLAGLLCGVPQRVYMLRGLRLETASGFKRRFLLAAERVAAACAHVVLCNSESLRAEALALGIAPAAKMRLMGNGSSNGVDLERFSPGPSEVREQFGIAGDAPVVGFVGRLTRDKGLPELVEAFESILRVEAEAHLLLVGWFDAAEDALDEELRNRIIREPRIHLTGFVDSTAPYYRAMDVLVLPTWREGFPNVVLEAAATGISTVTTASTGARDSVVPEVTGLLIPPGYPEAICEATLKLLREPERRRRMGQAARAWVVEHFADRRILGLTAAYYRSLLESPRGGDRARFSIRQALFHWGRAPAGRLPGGRHGAA